MRKLVYLALCFLVAFIVIGQLPAAAADVANEQSPGEETEASEGIKEEAIGASTGLTTPKKFVKNDVPSAVFAKSRKILQEPNVEFYDCEEETISCGDLSTTSSCGGPDFCECETYEDQNVCQDTRFFPIVKPQGGN